MNTRPLPYQVEGVRALERFGGRAILGDAPGLGKTFQALWWLDRNRHALPAVVVCPASLKLQWQQEARKHFSVRAEVLTGTRPFRRGLARPPRLTIVNYEILRDWLPYLASLGVRTVIADEGHRLKNPATIQSRAFKLLIAGVPHVLVLTGTAICNRTAELWTLLNVVRPDLWPSFLEYANRYCGAPRDTPWGLKFDGASNLEELHGALKETVLVRRLKEDVLPYLPPKRRVILRMPVELTEYRRAARDFIGWLRDQSLEKARRASKAAKLVQMGALRRLAANLKLASVVDWIDCFLEDTDEKLVVLGDQVELLEKLHQRYARRSVLVYGATPSRDRQLAVDRFQNHDQTKLFVGNIRTAGLGLNLTAATNVLFAELDWVPANMVQGEDRCHRLTTRGSVTAWWTIAAGTIEEHLAKILQDKAAVIAAALDGRDGKHSPLDVFDLLEQEMLKEKGVA